jgi:hypothetical protein
MIGLSQEAFKQQFHRYLVREYINQEDLTKAARKVGEAKKHESKL